MSLREIVALPTLTALTGYVQQVLCQENGWEPEATQLTRLPIRRGSQLCGLMLQVRGPKNQLCHAIWAEAEHRLLFYNTAGARFAEVGLSEAPDLTSFPDTGQQVRQAA